MKNDLNTVQYTLRISQTTDDFVQELAHKRGLTPTTLMRSIIGEYMEKYQAQEKADNRKD